MKKAIASLLLLGLLLGASLVFLFGRNLFLPRKRIIEVKIGNLLPLNPDLLDVAKTIKNSVDLAAEDLHKKYGDRLLIQFFNVNGCYASESIPAVQSFIRDGVSIIGSSFCLFGHIPILPLIEAHKIITFNTAANPDVTLNKRFAFSTNVEVRDQAAKMAEFAYRRLGRRSAVTMHLDTPFGHDYSKYFGRRFQELGGRFLLNFPNAPNGKNFRTMIDKIKALNPDIIVTAHFGVPLGLFIKEVRKAKITVPILGNYEAEDQTIINRAGNAAEGVMMATSQPEKNTKAMEIYSRRYIRRFGIEPDDIATNTYDDIVLGVETFIRCSGDRDCMARELHKVEKYPGASGEITIQASGATRKPTEFKIVRNHTFIYFDSQSVRQ